MAKTATIRLNEIKCSDGWYELGNDLGMSNEQVYETFEYGEFGCIEIIVDENLNIIGGKVIPCGK